MNTERRIRRSALIFISSTSILAINCTLARAQQAAVASPTPPDQSAVTEIVVTGSRIRGVAPVGSSVVSIDRKEMAALGTATAVDLLRTIPAVLNLGADPSHLNGNQSGTGNVAVGSGINLRGLGTNATLLLIDGNRIAPSGINNQFTDPSVIPAIALGNVEVVADGASAIYGADAVGGVVNLKLRDPFNGGEVTARYQTGTGEHEYLASGIVGHKWTGGGIMLAYEHNFQSPLRQSSVPNLYTDNFTAHGLPNFGSTNAAPGNLIVGSTYYPLPNNPNRAFLTASQLTASSPNQTSYYAGDFYVLPQQTRDSIVFKVYQNVTDNIKFGSEGFYSSREFAWNRSSTTFYNSPLSVPAVNPFYITGVPGLAPGANESVGYSWVKDIGAEKQHGYIHSGSLNVNATVDLGHHWQVAALATYSQEETYFIQYNPNFCALYGGNGPNPTTGLGGTTVNGVPCTGTPALYDPNPATAFDPFAAGAQNAATLAKVIGSNQNWFQYNRTAEVLKADGPIFDLPGGAVRLAVGLEHYYDYYRHSIVENNQGNTPDIQTFISPAGSDDRNVTSAYGELFVPIVSSANALPFAQRLDLSVAGRYDNYTGVGSTANPKVGITWKPVDDVNVHGSYGTSFRAPTLSDVAGITVLGTGSYAPTNFANTLYPSLGVLGKTVPGITITGGGVGLQPETATTYSLGIDYAPKWAPGLKLTANYYNIDYKNIINKISAGSALTDPTLASFVNINPTAAQIAAIKANPLYQGSASTSILVIVTANAHNLGEDKTNGLDFTANYTHDTRLGTLSAGLQGTYVASFQQALVPGAPLIQQDNNLNFPLRLSGRANFGWQKDGLSAIVYFNYQNAYTNAVVIPNQSVSSYSTVDLTLNYGTAGKYSSFYAQDVLISLHVQNLLNATPPFVYQAGAPQYAFDPQNASALGRVVSLQLTKKF